MVTGDKKATQLHNAENAVILNGPTMASRTLVSAERQAPCRVLDTFPDGARTEGTPVMGTAMPLMPKGHTRLKKSIGSARRTQA
jgi:hypothetical protein